MANEATIRTSLIIKSGELDYGSKPTAFNADVAGSKGPSPGAITVATTGTDVDLSELSSPSLCRLMNLDGTNYVTVGVWDPENSLFFPSLELLPGETYIVRLSRFLQWEFGTGTGTSGSETNTLRMYADTAACDVLVEAFEI